MKSYIHFYKKNDEFTKAYNGPDYKEPWLSLTEEGMKVNYNKPKLTAITFGSITWVTDVPATGGTASKDNCEFKVYGNYEDGTSADISSIVTVTGELVVSSSKADQRQEVGQLTLTASYGGFSATGNVIVYQEAVDFSMEPLTFNILSAGTINWTASNSAVTKAIDYKKNNGEWVSITSNTGSSAPSIDVNPGDKIQFRGNNAQYATGTSAYNSFNGSTAWFEVEGNIMSLIYGDDFKNNSTISSDYTFEDLFRDCANLVSAENLVLPATTLTDYCYSFMFYDCTSLTTAPELPAMALTMGCYFGMFRNCSSLKTAPELPAMALKMGCYFGMFAGCTSLTTAPALPANTLADNCYTMMFSDCTSLTTAPELPATTLKNYCYGEMFGNCAKLTKAPELPAMALVEGCYAGMFGGCTSLTVAPELPATTLATQCYDSMLYGTNVLPDCSNIDFASSTVVASRGLNGLFSGTKVTDNDLERLLPKNDNGRYYLPVTTLRSNCYDSMFSYCTSLTTAPELPATTLAEACYQGMFSNCTSLIKAPELPATKLAGWCYNNMFRDCTSLNYIKCLATDISASNCTGSWVDGVASTGTFVKASSMTSWETGTSGIPTGWAVVEDNQEPLTFNILSAGTINWKASSTSIAKTIDYKLNDNEWVSITSNTGESAPTITVNSGDKIQFRGNNATYCGDNPELYSTFGGSTAEFEIEGNIMSLINSTDFVTATTLESNFTFAGLFSNCTGLTSAENLILPAATLAMGCYFMMFQGCTSLTTAPKLPARTLATSCYSSMFKGCTSLTTAPELPANTLANSCYSGMFQGCTSLTTAPQLPATTLVDYCYQYMFNGCTSLKTAPKLPAKTLVDSCYKYMFQGCTSLTTAPELPATTLVNYCYSSMFQGCTSLTTAPQLPATTLAESCYENMFNGCTSLTTAPKLPATTLVDSCYYGMFYGCTSLNYIKCLATNISATRCTTNWVDSAASTGTFVKAADMTGWTTGTNGIPVNWTVEEYVNYAKEPLTFKISSDGTINWMTSNSSLSKTIEYKLNDSSNWLSITSNRTGVTINVSVGDKIQFRGNNATYYTNTFSGSTAGFEVEGNIMSLINSTDFITATTLQDTNTFRSLFNTCTGLTSAENLVLPATTLAESCYNHMFKNCTSLTTAPALPATTLATYCYSNMFDGCTSLTTAPELPATTLVTYCYNYMFYGCRKLNYIKCLAKNISASKCTNRWVSNVASTGTFVKASSMTSWSTDISGIPTNWTVQNA